MPCICTSFAFPGCSEFVGWLLCSRHQPFVPPYSSMHESSQESMRHDVFGLSHNTASDAIDIVLPYERCQRRGTSRFAGCAPSLSRLLRRDATSFCAEMEQAWYVCICLFGYAPGSLDSATSTTMCHPWRRPLRCLGCNLPGKRVVSLTKACTSHIFRIFLTILFYFFYG